MAYSVSWDSYQHNICNGLSSLQQRGQFVDMTLAADGHHVKVHQMVMSLVSPYIRDLISSAACPHPVIFLNKISYETLQSVLQYAYTGEVMVAREKMVDFLEACKGLCIRGVEELHHTTTVDAEGSSSFDTETYTQRASTNLRDNSQNKTKRDSGVIKKTYDDYSDDYVMDTAFDNDDEDDTPLQPRKKRKRSSDNQLEKTNLLPDPRMSLQYTVSIQGNLQLVCNRYMYFLMSSRKSGERMWRCITYKRGASCRAFLTTKDNQIIKRVGAHNHPFHDKQIMKKMDNGHMFAALNDVEKAIEEMKKKPTSCDTTGSETAVNASTVITSHASSSIPQIS